MEFTPEQITEIISEITNGAQGFQVWSNKVLKV